MTVIICPGIHNAGLSDRFLRALNQQLASAGAERGISPTQVLPTQRYAPFNGFAVWSFLQTVAHPQAPLLLIGFSAGVVGAITAAQLWRAQGRAVSAVIAVDGWGMPQIGDFSLYRVSHDYFTHWSSAMLGSGDASFYSDPAVAHLDLWQFPERAAGVWVSSSTDPTLTRKAMTAIAFIAAIVCQYEGAKLTDR